MHSQSVRKSNNEGILKNKFLFLRLETFSKMQGRGKNMFSEKEVSNNLLKMSSSYWESFILHVAVKLNIFGIIGKGTVTSEFISTAINGRKDGLLRLLDALSAMGLIRKIESKYQNSEISNKYLSPESENYLGNIIKHHANLVEKWANLQKIILHDELVEQKKERNMESFLMGMHDISMINAPKIVPLIDLTGKKYLLDLGGGPGTYAVHFCKENPQLKACVFDLPATQPFMEKIVKNSNLSNKIFFKAGDFINDSIGSGYDITWLSHILHSLSRSNCRKLLRKINYALNRQGMILIHDFILNDSLDSPLFPAIFSLNMLIGTKEGRSYSERQLSKLLKECGFGKIKKIELDNYNESSILIGVKP